MKGSRISNQSNLEQAIDILLKLARTKSTWEKQPHGEYKDACNALTVVLESFCAQHRGDRQTRKELLHLYDALKQIGGKGYLEVLTKYRWPDTWEK